MKNIYLQVVLIAFLSGSVYGQEELLIQRFDNVITREPDRAGKNAKVWNVKKTEILRINLVEFTGEMTLHKHPDAVHSFLILEGEAKVIAGDSSFTMFKNDFISIPENVPHKLWPITPKVYIVSMDAPYYDPSKTIRLE